MIPEKIKNRAQTAEAMIRASNMDAHLQDACLEMLYDAENGMDESDEEEQRRNLSENMFSLTFTLILHMAETSTPPPVVTWREVVIECRKEIVVGLGILAILFVLRPQLAAIVEALF